MSKQSAIERQHDIRLAGLEDVVRNLAVVVGEHLPATKNSLDGLISMLRGNIQTAVDHYVMDMMVGNGPVATARRRADPLTAGIIQLAIPHPYVLENDQSQYKRSDEIKSAVNYYLSTRPLKGDSHYEWCVEKLLAADSPAIIGEFPRTLGFAALKSGFYHYEDPNRSWYSGAKRKWVLVVELNDVYKNNRSVVMVHCDGRIKVETWVPIEETWVQHDNLRYVDLPAFVGMVEALMESWGLIPENPPTEEQAVAELESLVRAYEIQPTTELSWSLPSRSYPTQGGGYGALQMNYQLHDFGSPEQPLDYIRRHHFQVREGSNDLSLMWNYNRNEADGKHHNFVFRGNWYGMDVVHNWNALPIPFRRDVIDQMVRGLNTLKPPEAPSSDEAEVSEASATD